jgi:hypothetical protein
MFILIEIISVILCVLMFIEYMMLTINTNKYIFFYLFDNYLTAVRAILKMPGTYG